MPASTGERNLTVAGLMIEELVRCGADYFCLSPGSRCTPLTVAAARQRSARRTVLHDERAAGYQAVGYARATGQPAVLICTSGTAAANYLPAVVEASMDRLPMILLTADRPPELQDCGANQAIGQAGLYGRYVRRRFDLPCPDDNAPAEYFLTTVDQAAYAARRSPAGPVHINCMFREPFLPEIDAPDILAAFPGLSRWRDGSRPFTSYEEAQHAPDDDLLSLVSGIVKSADTGVLLVGRLGSNSERIAVERLARQLNWPVLADITSGLRLGADINTVVPHYDLLLQSVEPWALERPFVVLHLGGGIVSKRLMVFLKAARPDEYVHVAGHPFRDDWQHLVTQRLECHPVAFCDAVAPHVASAEPSKFAVQLCQAADTLGRSLDQKLADHDGLSEPTVARLIAENTPGSSGLFVANSLPVRLLDSFAGFKMRPLSETPLLACNRGASGIDGTVATASGYSVGLARPVTILIGDLALLHDLNSLSIVRTLPHPMTIVLINNDGGGIFSLLPVADRTDLFEPYFATPHGLTFETSARQFGLEYFAPGTPDDLVADYRQALKSARSSLIELTTSRRATRDLYSHLLEAASQAVAEL